ncbi:MAG TPA: gliding motility-associated C-terminal domain-containing protein [Chitinophagaceae bacterium]|jgi:gliding motility-associated-like protein|nr:gliding motility-associated C-terminal domain-containing protein [Chitinophagaceae bacterium]
MRKLIFSLLGSIGVFVTNAQNPATVFTIANRNVLLPCGTNCTTITAQVPHIKQTSTYVITNPAYLPFAYTTPTGMVPVEIYDDDHWSSVINTGFNFCFYGSIYSSLLMGSNSAITFNTSLTGQGSGYIISATTGAIPNTAYAASMIFGPYHDIDPGLSSANKKIEWRVEGTAPKRRFIASYNDMPYFGTNCTAPRATHQMVLYESTGVIEVYIKDKPFCTGWNSGMTILGIQNQSRTSAVAAPGKNATVWGQAAMDSCFRFIPSGGVSRLKSAQLVVNGTVVASADTSTLSAGVLNLNFPNVCPTADSTAYVLRVTYTDCIGDPPTDVVFTDTVFVKKDTPPAFTATKTDASCSTTGSITVTPAPGVTPPFEYSINNGTAWQASSTFTGLAAGTYEVKVRKLGSLCALPSTQVVITFTNNLTMNNPAGASICLGASFTPQVTGNAATYSWTPTTGVSNPGAANPVLTPTQTTTYTVTGTLGTCTIQRTVTVTVSPGASANAGPDAIILAGDTYQMQATASAGTYLWTPSTALSATNILNPTANPTLTTTYTLRVTTGQGCFALDDMTITVVPYCVKPMNAFTPNGDGINELWLITSGNCLSRAKAQVFNRYGAKVFESNDYKNTWDGTYEGKPLPDGTYYYIIDYKLLNGKSVFMKGNVTILR